MQAAFLSFDQICSHRTAQTSGLICSTKRYRASSCSEFTRRGSRTSTNWSNTCSAFGFVTDNSISDNAVDEWWGHVWSCITLIIDIHDNDWVNVGCYSWSETRQLHFSDWRHLRLRTRKLLEQWSVFLPNLRWAQKPPCLCYCVRARRFMVCLINLGLRSLGSHVSLFFG